MATPSFDDDPLIVAMLRLPPVQPGAAHALLDSLLAVYKDPELSMRVSDGFMVFYADGAHDAEDLRDLQQWDD